MRFLYPAVLFNGGYPVFLSPVKGYAINDKSGSVFKFLILKMMISLDQVGSLMPIWPSPGGPEVDHHHLASQGGEGDFHED